MSLCSERRRPIGMDAYLTIDRNAVYVDPTPETPETPETPDNPEDQEP